MKILKMPVKYTEVLKEVTISEDLLGTRASNVLLRNKITTLYDVYENYESIRRLKGVGTTVMKKINSIIFDTELEKCKSYEDVIEFIDSLEVVTV